ncbi:helix-turn-helix domain-containing protein [Carnobacterium sp. FSL E2-0243]|jgi:predicted DNA-binding transcriptional regulator AlpA|uniref:helix-turn-helix domain-containing protein n=1 Tax=Carnobacterium sp. FSL E2-0243 TaxID=2921365 RepID=UPI0030FB2F11
MQQVAEWKTVKEVAAHFKVSTKTIYRWTNDRNNPLPNDRKDSIIRIDLIEADNWFKNKSQAGGKVSK